MEKLDGVSRVAENYGLTKKETKVIRHLIKGKCAKEIAQKENITYETSRWYIKQIYQKLRVNKQTQLMSLVMQESSSSK